MSSSDNFDLLCLIAPEIKCMKILGFWKSPDVRSFYNSIYYKTYRCLVVIGFVLFQFPGYIYVYQKRDMMSISDVTAILYVYIQVFNILCVTLCVFFNMDILHSIIEQLRSNVLQPRTPGQFQIAQQLKKSGDLVRVYYYFSSIFVIVVHPLINLTRTEKEPLYAGYVPLQLGVIGLLAFQEVMTVYSVFLCSNCVSLDANLLIEISIQIEILKDILENSDDVVIFECIERYEEILRLADKVQRIMRVGISVYFITGVLILCTTLFRILEVVVSELMFMLPYSFAIILIIFIHCWFGTELIYRSNGITKAIFTSKWIGREPSIQKTIIIFMIFTKKPIHINLAGGLFTMTIPVFITICRTAYSYFTLLQKFG